MGYNWYQWHPMVGAWDWEKSRQRYEAEATFQPIAIFIGTMMIYRWIRGTVFQAFLEFSPWWLSCLNVGVPWGFVRTLVFHGLKLLQSQGPLLVNSTKKSCYNFSPKIMQQDPTMYTVHWGSLWKMNEHVAKYPREVCLLETKSAIFQMPLLLGHYRRFYYPLFFGIIIIHCGKSRS